MKSVLVSIKPRYCELIATGRKTLEVRKTRPKLETPFKAYIYCTKSGENLSYSSYCGFDMEDFTEDFAANGNVIGEFICDRIYQYTTSNCTEGMDITTEEVTRMSCLTYEELRDYELNAEPKENRIYLVGLYCWHISNLKIYDKPKPLESISVVDNKAVKNCTYRERIFTNPDLTNGAFLPGSYLCTDKTDWCTACKTKALTRPPQSWCYVEGF